MTETRQMLTDIFEEIALIIGGLEHCYEIPDDAIWTLIRSIDAVRLRAVKRLNGVESTGPTKRLVPNPAIEEFILKNRKQGNDATPPE
jgi:hypothetical protein